MEIKEILNLLKVKKTAEFVQCPRCGALDDEYELYKYLNPIHCPHCGFVYEQIHTKDELVNMHKKFNEGTVGRKMSFKKYCDTYNLIDIDKLKLKSD